jgi:hypothetical protein
MDKESMSSVFETGLSESTLSQMIAVIEDSPSDTNIQKQLTEQVNLPVILHRDIHLNSNLGGIFVLRGATVVAGYTVEKLLSGNPSFTQTIVNFKVVLNEREVETRGLSVTPKQYNGIVNVKGITCISFNNKSMTYDFLAVLDNQR